MARRLTALGAVVGAGAGIALSMLVLLSGMQFALMLPSLLPLAGGLALRLDPLGAFFLLLIGIGAIPAALYGVGYSAEYEHGRASLRLLGVMFNLFLLTMSLVTLADNVLTFLFVWEGMSLTSYFLVMTEANTASDNGETQRAGLWYAAMTHAGLAFLMAAFLLLAGDQVATFANLRAGAAALPSTTRNLIFVFALLGFGSKAGIVPLHVWLPRCPPCRAQPRLGAHVRCDDQDGGIRALACGTRPAGRRSGVVGSARVGSRRRFSAARHPVCADGKRSEATAGLFKCGEHWHHLYWSWRRNALHIAANAGGGHASFCCGFVPFLEPCRLQDAAVHGCGCRAARHPHA